jgi:CHAD domain-containing protein
MMARARDVGELDCEGAFALAAARVIEIRADEVLEHSAGVLDVGDIERVHDMRVATRRLQAALAVFRKCFPREQRRAALKQVKALADALGERRDPDVSIETLERLAGQAGIADRRGVDALIEHFKREQEAANERLGPFVTEARLQGLRADLRQLTRAARELVGVERSPS